MSYEVRTISSFEKQFKNIVYLAAIFDKSEISGITDAELKLLANQIG